LIFPSVKEGINWDRFVKRTKAGSKEPAHQRGLEFDTIVGRKLSEGFYDCLKSSARIWSMDAKPVDKKLRGGKVPVVLPLTNNEAMFDCLKKEGIKIGVLSTATVICHYVHECLGNILEAAGVQVNP
jgi:hypothetical protein